jgi:hypothetical protein
MSGDVGIFWVDQGQLIMASVPLADGIDDGRFVNGPYDHEPYWATVQRSHVHLWDVEYHQVPRGRVLFNKAEDRFYVYLHIPSDFVVACVTAQRTPPEVRRGTWRHPAGGGTRPPAPATPPCPAGGARR